MNKRRPNTAKILVHSEGLGAPHMEQVRKRAEEIALINGRARFSETDWRQAKAELHGTPNLDGNGSDEMAISAMVSEPDMVACDAGHHTERMPMEDEGNTVEELILEGMDEAVHERMLAARAELEEMDEPDAL